MSAKKGPAHAPGLVASSLHPARSGAAYFATGLKTGYICFNAITRNGENMCSAILRTAARRARGCHSLRSMRLGTGQVYYALSD